MQTNVENSVPFRKKIGSFLSTAKAKQYIINCVCHLMSTASTPNRLKRAKTIMHAMRSACYVPDTTS